LKENNTLITIRNTLPEDIPKIVKLQEDSFPYLARYGNVWHPSELQSHIRLFQEGQFCAELNGAVVASASSLIVFLEPEYKEHTWKDITADGTITNHDPKGDSIYGADISTHPKVRHEGIGKMLYDARKGLVKRLNLRRMISGGRLFNYCEHANIMSTLEFAQKVIKGELQIQSFPLS
jgi:hypothetical protein